MLLLKIFFSSETTKINDFKVYLSNCLNHFIISVVIFVYLQDSRDVIKHLQFLVYIMRSCVVFS